MAASWANEASSSSSSSTVQRKYDVFLSFSGIDTRLKFTSHLLAALEQHGFYTFRDDTKLNRGEDIGFELLKAIEESSISIIVFSKNYAMSKWCLDELVWIMECRKTFNQIILPIFYDVDPSNVRAQNGILAEAFAKHEEHFRKSADGKVEKWRAALTEAANLSGWDLKNVYNGDEAKLIAKIIEEVGNVIDLEHLSVADHPVGLEDRVQELRMLLRMESNDNDVRIVAVWGIGGLGKTTIAKNLYKLIHRRFDGSSFLADVRETWKKSNGLLKLQEQLLSDIFKNEIHHIRNIHQGKEVIIRRALRRKVLLVLDDVDDIKQLKELAIDQAYFGSGSRIIITTRDLSSLNFEVDEIYTPEELDENKSLQLFSWHAFKEDHPIENYVELSKQVVDYAKGLPLALEILGSFLSRIRSISEWESAIEKLKKIPHEGIQEKLEISYNSLSKEVKELFLDIACFFVGMNRNFIIKILKGCKVFPEIGLRILFDRCLIKYGPFDELEMHDMVRDMGREIVKKESNDEPGRRSRLWHHEDGLEVLRYGTGTKVVKGLFLNFPESKEVQVNAKAFENMNELWLLHLDYVHLSLGFEHNFRRLLWLSWNGCPLVWLPSKLYIEKLVALDLRYSKLKQVWKGTKDLNNLKFLYLSHCYYLTKTPNFSGLNNLEELLIDNCIRLVEIDESIGCLNKLIVLDMANCKKLEQFPSSILMLKSLEYLDLSGCSKLREFAGFKGSLSESLYTFFSSWALPRKNVDFIGFSLQGLRSLKTLKIANMSYLPSEIESLVTLTHLDLSGSKFLRTLPDSIYNLTRLQRLDMKNCNVSYLSSDIGNLISLTHLDLNGNDLRTLPDSIGNLTHLQILDMAYCNLSNLSSEIGNLVSLTDLDLTGNDLCALPDSIGNLTRLQLLNMEGCNVSHLPSEIWSLISLRELDLGENNLRSLPDSIGNLTCLTILAILDCNVSYLPSEIGSLISLERLFLDRNNLCKLPDSIGNLTHLECLSMTNCNVSHLPSEIGSLISLTELFLDGNNLCTLPDSVGNLYSLFELGMNNCNLSHLPSAIWKLLKWHSLSLSLKGCHKLTDSNFVNNVMKAAIWQVKDYCALYAIHGFVSHSEIHLTWGEVPRWFEYQTEGSYLSVKVPPLINQKIWSLAICVIYIGSNSNEKCNSFHLEYHINKVQRGSSIICDYDRLCSEDQMCLKFMSMSELESGDEVEIFITKWEHIQVKKCAAKLFFDVDEDTDDEDTDGEALAD
ncbi:TMV resistance protein N [Camellia lanceoleosa]|uniref:TMV resistance protein N n=1 Tax=Camellia lanceoleosa TaxID=1840588 RepID=A0ACC0F847_9ERIC|nr:TMV resistance protein N [Camellia lanceoleosa]